MVSGIVQPVKKVFGLVDRVIRVKIKDEEKSIEGRLIAVDEYLNIHMEEAVEYGEDMQERYLGTVVIRGNNIFTISPSG